MIKAFAIAILYFLLAACAGVTSTSPVGDEPVDVTGLIGVWTLGSQVIYVTDKDAAHGILTLTEVFFNGKKKQPDIAVFSLHIHRSGETLFASIDEGGSAYRDFPFALLKVDPKTNFENTKHATLSIPNEKAFARLVKSGTLQGEVSKKKNGEVEKVIIEGITAKEAAVLGQLSNRDLFTGFTGKDNVLDGNIDSLILIRHTDLHMREVKEN